MKTINNREDIEHATYNSIIKNNVSLIRWGDGEYQLLLLNSIHFQQRSIILSVLLLLLLLISVFHQKVVFAYPSKTIIKTYDLNTRPWRVSKLFSKLIRDSKFSPFIFREEGAISSDKILTLIHQYPNRIYVGKNIAGVDRIFQEFIYTPRINSFQFFLKRNKEIINILKRYDVIFLSAGPGGKIIGLIMILFYNKKIVDFGHGIDKLLS